MLRAHHPIIKSISTGVYWFAFGSSFWCKCCSRNWPSVVLTKIIHRAEEQYPQNSIRRQCNTERTHLFKCCVQRPVRGGHQFGNESVFPKCHCYNPCLSFQQLKHSCIGNITKKTNRSTFSSWPGYLFHVGPCGTIFLQ